ncbi:MbcA/ParS/Xre antitoxin family protein [Magnetospirillum sp. UT-4]|uniref:MbcA/ParS/Xre antitoxin family protein n=1 Tax=Magnetospirillum sp. UT-4 TaxID=2681467 RepID=UPI00138070CE|nr:MbcA/ParS/Xre antitoxin family protein [Magnetospirillum sp. UT-4]CAA7626808.1 conserved hypothetical protein [Magnetospirillum sp. UT-4]
MRASIDPTIMTDDREANLAEITNRIRALLVGEGTRQGEAQASRDEVVKRSIQRLTVLANHVFGDEAKARIWLTQPQPDFQGRSILQLAEHESTATQIEEALHKIDEQYLFSN